MQFVESQSIARCLFEEYYVKPQDAAELYASSHWRLLHKEAKVDFGKDTFVSLVGSGFGDLQNRSLVYRVFSWLTISSYLVVLKERWEILSLFAPAFNVIKRAGLHFTYDVFRQVCVVAALKPFLNKPVQGVRVLNIGDGYGFLSLLIKEIYPQAKIVFVDLGKTLLFQAYYCQKVFPQARVFLVKKDESAVVNTDFIFCAAENLELINDQKFDVVINIASMQEMNVATISRYFKFLRCHIEKEGVFYCCNREEKVMPAGEVSRFEDYPWDKKDKHIWDEICPWYRFFFSFHQAKCGPRIWKIRLPFVNYFDGAVRHRLTKLVE